MHYHLTEGSHGPAGTATFMGGGGGGDLACNLGGVNGPLSKRMLLGCHS